MNAVKTGIPVERMYYHTPLGKLKITATGQGISAVQFTDEFESPALRGAIVENCIHELGEYFAGKRMDFDVPLAPVGSPFQMRAWKILQKIPAGQTRSYSWMAERLGDPNARRAVGHANGCNMLCIIIPCHRVIRADGTLCGYGGGLWRKKWLLDHEKKFTGSGD